MEKSKNLTLFFEFLEDIHFGKDPFLAPYTLGQILGYSVTIIYPRTERNRNLPDSYKGVKLVPLNSYGSEGTPIWIRYREFFSYIWRHAHEIDILMRFFDIDLTAWSTNIYKIRNPRGKVYVKMDVNPFNLNANHPTTKRKLISYLKLKKWWNGKYHQGTTVISCESSLAYNRLNFIQGTKVWGDKLVFMPNGFDESLMKELGIVERTYNEKENIIITVARLGTYPKNTPMILRALSQLKMGNWKCYLIGPIESDFRKDIDDFFINNPHLKKSVIFTDAINDKKELWEYYNRSKIFIFASMFESYCLAFNEAKRFGNYIITTNVGAAGDIIQNEEFGEFVEQDDDVTMAKKIQNVIDGKTDISHVYDRFDISSLSWNSVLKEVANRLK